MECTDNSRADVDAQGLPDRHEAEVTRCWRDRLVSRSCFPRPVRSRIGSQQIRRRAVVRPFSNFSRTGDKNSADRRTIRHARFVATVHGPELIVCASQTVRRHRSEQVTNHAERRTAFQLGKTMDTHPSCRSAAGSYPQAPPPTTDVILIR